MVPNPQVEANVASVRAPAREPLKRWPLLRMISFAVIVSLILWAAIFALIGVVVELAR